MGRERNWRVAFARTTVISVGVSTAAMTASLAAPAQSRDGRVLPPVEVAPPAQRKPGRAATPAHQPVAARSRPARRQAARPASGIRSAASREAAPLAPVSAQGAPRTAQGGSGTSDPYAGMVNPPTTVGSKTPLAQREIPQTLGVMTQAQIQQQNIQTLDQALQYTPGVTVLQSDSDRYQFYARGFPISSLQIDGLPVVMNPNLSQTSSTGAPNLTAFDRIEVLDGPAGLYNGFGSAGGAINLVRKRAPYELAASAEARLGTFDTRGALIDIGGPLNAERTVRARFVADLQNQDLTQHTTWRRDQSFFGTVEADLTPDTLARFGASHSERTQHSVWQGSPVYMGNIVVPSRSTYFGADWNRGAYDATDVYASVEHKFDNGWLLKGAGDYTCYKSQIIQSDIYTFVNPANNLATIGSNNKQGYESNKSFDVFASGPFQLLGREHQLTLGVNYTSMNEWQRTKYGPDGDDFNSRIVNVYNIFYPYPVWLGLPTDTDANKTNTSQVGLYGNTRLRITDDLTAIVGGRVSWWKSDFIPDAVYNYDNYAPTHDTYNAKVTPYGGLVYKLNDTYSVYGSYSTIFQPQTLYDAAGKLIPPLEGIQYEAGIKGEYLDGKLNTSLALFQVTQKNRAALDPNYPLDSFYIAQGKARTRGVDVRVSGQLAEGWTLNAGYTYNDSKYLDKDSFDTQSSAFSQIAPMHIFKLWTNYRLPGPYDRWQVGAGINATSSLYYENTYGRLTQKGYFTADARVSYAFTEKVSLNLNVTNIFDKEYFAPLRRSVFWGDPRRVTLTLRGSF